MSFADATMTERRQLLEDALAEVLNRDSTMDVDTDAGERCLWIWREPFQESKRGHSLWDIACELERRLT